METATKNFDKSKVIGSGGFGGVYKGELSHYMGRRNMVAFKRLKRKLGQFWKEIMMLYRYKHQNLNSLDYNSRFQVGTFNTRNERLDTCAGHFKTHVYELEYDEVLLNKYHKICVAIVTPLIYRSIKELKLLLLRGVLLNNCKTWFYLNEKGQHCEMISIKECLILDETKRYPNYTSAYNSRFPSGSLLEYTFNCRTRFRPQFLQPYITYTVNLVFKFKEKNDKIDNTVEQCQINLKYRLDGETKNWISYLAHKREDNWWMVELFQFTSGGTIDIEIIFEENQGYIVVEGIEFQPFENVEHQPLENMEDIQPISNSDLDDSYWEQKLPNDYNDIIKLSKDGVQWTTKKELYSIFCTGFLINNSVRWKRNMFFSIFSNNSDKWFFLDKNGKKCQMLSAKEAFKDNDIHLYQHFSWDSLHYSSFGKLCVVRYDWHGGKLHLNKIKYQGLSTGTTYACYLVYQLICDNISIYGDPVKVSYANLGSNDRNNCWYLYLVSPQTPVIVNGKVDYHNTMNKPKINYLPQQRIDGWMETKVCEFVTDTSFGVIPRLVLKSWSLIEVRIKGIELRST